MKKNALQKAKERIESLEHEMLELRSKASFFDALVEAVFNSDRFKSELHDLVDDEMNNALDDLRIER